MICIECRSGECLVSPCERPSCGHDCPTQDDHTETLKPFYAPWGGGPGWVHWCEEHNSPFISDAEHDVPISEALTSLCLRMQRRYYTESCHFVELTAIAAEEQSA